MWLVRYYIHFDDVYSVVVTVEPNVSWRSMDFVLNIFLTFTMKTVSQNYEYHEMKMNTNMAIIFLVQMRVELLMVEF